MKKNIEKIRKKAIGFGLLGSLLLLSFYLIVLTLTNSFEHALQQLFAWFPFISLLTAGFGIQVGLYSYTRDSLNAKKLGSESKTLKASGGISGTSMVLCCVHHLADVIPILGFSAFALFLSEFQFAFISMGILSNAVGIIMILSIMQKNKLIKFNSINFSSLKTPAIYVSILVIAGLFTLSFLGTSSTASVSSAPAESFECSAGDTSAAADSPQGFKTISREENGLMIAVTPVVALSSIEFQIRIDTHQGTNDFDLKESSVLIINGQSFTASQTEGFESGHHRSGKLFFTGIPTPKNFSLVIKNAYGVPERVFEWGPLAKNEVI